MENICITGPEGKTRNFIIQSSKMNRYKVSELRALIRDRMGISIEHQRLIYGTKQLEDTYAGSTMTFQDYGIKGGATIMLLTRLPGFRPQEAADLSSQPPQGRNNSNLQGFDGLQLSTNVSSFRDLGVSTGQCESNPFSNIGVEFFAARSRGDYFRETRDQTRTVLFHPKSQCNTCLDDSGLRMECGHYICPDCLLDWTWEQLSNMKYEIGCNECDKPIKQDDIIKFGLPTLEEKQFLITAITTDYYESQDIQECPQCRTLCQRTRTDNPQVHCTVCPKKRGNLFMFCWYCMREWNNPSNYQICGNVGCKREIIDMLVKSPFKEIGDLRGKRVRIPSIRACPKCQTLLEHEELCNQFACFLCKQKFCFICLACASGGSLVCKSSSLEYTGIVCTPAPIQTKLR